MVRKRLRRTVRFALFGVGAAVVLTAIVALAIQFRIRIADEWQSYAKLPTLSVPTNRARILVFAPHCDDETLGPGGLIAAAAANGASVRVVLLTNGDGFRIGVARYFNTVRVTPSMCVKYAYARQKETLAAVSVLGVKARDVTFLGYPDRGIARMWSDHWSSRNPYTSVATKTDHSPYINSMTFHAPYCGEGLLNDIEHVIARDKPTDIYLPHPSDNHPDHLATYCFVAAAVEQLHAEKAGVARKIKLHTYLVHRGDWPTPKGYHPRQPLAPPHGLAGGDTKWYSFPLSPELAQLKRKAIREYKSQTAMELSFLMSFVRANEIIGDLPVRLVKHVPNEVVAADGEIEEWSDIPPAVVDPVGDYVVAGMNRGGDVRAIYLCHDDRSIYVRVDCARNLSKRVTYTLNFRGLSTTSRDDLYTISIKPPKRIAPEGTIWAYRNDHIEIAIPRKHFRLDDDVFVQVKTNMMKLTVDDTGWHSIEFEGAEKPPH